MEIELRVEESMSGKGNATIMMFGRNWNDFNMMFNKGIEWENYKNYEGCYRTRNYKNNFNHSTHTNPCTVLQLL